MTSDEYEDILYDHRILRWFARVLGTFEVALFLYLTFVEYREEVRNHSLSPLLTLINGQYFLAIFLTIACLGLILAYWKEGLGGGITLASFLVLLIIGHDFHASVIIGLGVISLPAVLYVAYWLSVKRAVKKAERDQA